MTDLTYRMAQINPTTGAIEQNKHQILDEIERAREDARDVVVFPEMAITGYLVGDMVENDAFVDDNLAALDEIAAYTDDMAVVLGFLDYADNDDKRYNSAAVLNDGEVKGTARKTLLPNYRYFDDERYFVAGDIDDIAPIDVAIDGDEYSLGVSICEDMWDEAYEHEPVQRLADQGADVLININASPFVPDKRQEREEIIQRHVEETDLPLLYVNTVGVGDVGANIVPFDGESLAYSADGQLAAKGERLEEDTVDVTFHSDGTAEEATTGLEELSRERQLYDALVMSIRDYMDKTGFETIIEPVSGGIDSSLGLAICADAVGPENVIAYNLPSRVNTETTKDIAEQLADNLGVEYRVLPIEPISDAAIDQYEQHVEEVEDTVAKENVYARVRGLEMMLESNENGGMLVTNGNETEMALGYCTLYGDMTGGISVLGDVSKMDVYRLSEHVNERHGEEVIPRKVFEIPPSAELSEGQEDPFDYQTVSPLVTSFLDKRQSPQELKEQFRDGTLDEELFDVDGEENVYTVYSEEDFNQLVDEIYGMFQGSAYKRVQAPPIIAVSERAFGKDFREPIINGWTEEA